MITIIIIKGKIGLRLKTRYRILVSSVRLESTVSRVRPKLTHQFKTGHPMSPSLWEYNSRVCRGPRRPKPSLFTSGWKIHESNHSKSVVGCSKTYVLSDTNPRDFPHVSIVLSYSPLVVKVNFMILLHCNFT